MARIPEAEIERLKSEVGVERLVEASGRAFRKSGKDLLGRCPLYADDTASLVVTPGKNLWQCFGCGAARGAIDWVIKKPGVRFRHAVELLHADPALAAGEGGPVGCSRVRKMPPLVASVAGEQEVLNQVIGYYHETLLASPEALAYQEKRGFGEWELIERATQDPGAAAGVVAGKPARLACRQWGALHLALGVSACAPEPVMAVAAGSFAGATFNYTAFSRAVFR